MAAKSIGQFQGRGWAWTALGDLVELPLEDIAFQSNSSRPCRKRCMLICANGTMLVARMHRTESIPSSTIALHNAICRDVGDYLPLA